MALWIVAYNLPTRTWTSGGQREDYDRAHYDVWVVEAADRDQAEQAGRTMRRMQRGLTAKQRQLLTSLLEENPGAADEAPAYSTEIWQDEVLAAKRLAQCGLITFTSEDERQVRLTAAAFNPSLAPEAEQRARALEYRLERKTASAPGRRTPGRL